MPIDLRFDFRDTRRKHIRFHIVAEGSRLRSESFHAVQRCGHRAEIYESLNELGDVLPTEGLILIVIEGASGDASTALSSYRETDCTLPPIICSKFPDIPVIVESIRLGSFDFLEIPITEDSINRIFENYKCQGDNFLENRRREISARVALEKLSPREREVLAYVVEGFSNKEAAEKLAISVRTLETHRQNLMKKMGASSLADTLKIWNAAISGGSRFLI